jgi:hypothetical protein
LKRNKLIRIYLNDHMAGAVVGEELTRRALKNNQGNEFGRFLAELLREISEDRRALAELMAREGVARNPVKGVGAWLAEKAGRVKANGRIRGYSDLSRLLEFEGLTLGVAGKRAGWVALMQALGTVEVAGSSLQQLAERATSQLERLEAHRLEAARIALGSSGSERPTRSAGGPEESPR